MYDVNLYVQTFSSLLECFTPVVAQNDFKMFIHEDGLFLTEHVCRYNGHSSPEVTYMIPESEDAIFGRRDTVPRRQCSLNSAGTELLHTVSDTYRSYNPLSYVLMLSFEEDGCRISLTSLLYRNSSEN